LGIAILGHVILVISALPPVIVHSQNSLAAFLVGLIIMGIGTGSFKPNISPLIAEQLPVTKMTIRTLPSGERVIVDPAVTASRVYHYFYLFINIGALTGQIAMVYVEKYIGYWLSFLLPAILLSLCPLILYHGRNRYTRSPPQGNVLKKAMGIFILGNRGRWVLNPVKTFQRLNDGTFWEDVKPSNIDPSRRPEWMTFDDQWVDEVRRGLLACSVFCWYPLYWIAYNQLNNNLTSQAALLKLNGLPNDILSNLNPLALIILIPIHDLLIYPTLRRYKIKLTPIRKITLGFYTGSLALLWACVVQYLIYKNSICGTHASGKPPPGTWRRWNEAVSAGGYQRLGSDGIVRLDFHQRDLCRHYEFGVCIFQGTKEYAQFCYGVCAVHGCDWGGDWGSFCGFEYGSEVGLELWRYGKFLFIPPSRLGACEWSRGADSLGDPCVCGW
jgi:POT family proton-dependent oligopeptide transporter